MTWPPSPLVRCRHQMCMYHRAASIALFKRDQGELTDDEVYELQDILYSQQNRLHSTLREAIVGSNNRWAPIYEVCKDFSRLVHLLR